MTEPTKRCSRCKEEKPLSAFYIHKSYAYNDNGSVAKWPGMPTAYCKLCNKEQYREHLARKQAARANRPPVEPLPALWSPSAPVNARGTASHRYYRIANAKRRADPQT